MNDQTQLLHILTVQKIDQLGEGVLKEILDEFYDYSPKMMEQMCIAVAQGNTEDLRLAAHSLKGSGLNIGAQAFSTVCMELEKLAKLGDLAAAPALIEQAQELYAQTRAAFQKLLNPQG